MAAITAATTPDAAASPKHTSTSGLVPGASSTPPDHRHPARGGSPSPATPSPSGGAEEGSPDRAAPSANREAAASAATPESKSDKNDDLPRSSRRPQPPPLEYVDVDPDRRLPRPSSSDDECDPDVVRYAEHMVRWAVSSKHENSPAAANNRPPPAAAAGGGDNAISSPLVEAARQHSRLCDLLARRTDSHLLRAVLVALACSNSGKELDRLAGSPRSHAQLVHLLMRLDPFLPPASVVSVSSGGGGNNAGGGAATAGGLEGLRELDAARRERDEKKKKRESEVDNGGKIGGGGERGGRSSRPRSVRIDETFVRPQEDAKHVAPASPYLSYRIADAHLHLLVSLVSSNSTFCESVLRCLWGMLTEFGSRWGEWAEGEARRVREAGRKRRRKTRERMMLESARKARREEGDREEEPAMKKRRIESPPRTPAEKGASEGGERAEEDDDEEPQQEEEERPAPGMGGLSVGFVRDALLYCRGAGDGGDEHEEEVYSDRLPGGRVRRILLALVNVFRLCPPSKKVLLGEMSTNFPHHRTCPPALHRWYAHQCLQAARLAPTLEGPVLCLLVDRALDMDVEIKINDRGMVLLDDSPREVEEEQVGANLDGLSPSSSRKRSYNQISNGAILAAAGNARERQPALLESADDESDRVLEISERLDALMSALCDRIVAATAFSPDSLRSAAQAVLGARCLHRYLDGAFDGKVLATDRSKFVQFAYFVLLGRENDALEAAARLMAKRERQRQRQPLQQQQQSEGGEEKERANEDEFDMVRATVEEEALETLVPAETATLSPALPIGLTEPLYRKFTTKLLDLFVNPNGGNIPRQAAVCYLASFVSRAGYVDPETACACVAALLKWAEGYALARRSGAIAAGEGEGGGATMRRLLSRTSSGGIGAGRPCDAHAPFYAACQAAFYIMCFRGAEVVGHYRRSRRHHICRQENDNMNSSRAKGSDESDVHDIGPGRWRLLCGHKVLQPLKYCLESVRLEFLHVAEDLDLFLLPQDGAENGSGDDDEKVRRDEAEKFLERLWETSSSTGRGGDRQMLHGPGRTPTKSPAVAASRAPKRRVVRTATVISTAATRERKRLDGGVGGLGRGSNPLGSFFPFDPYLLQGSYSHVHPYYRNWEDCIMTVAEEEDVDSYNDVECEEADGMDVAENDAVCDADEGLEDLSDLEDEGGIIVGDGEEEASDDDDDEEDEEEPLGRSLGPSTTTGKNHTAVLGFAALHEDSHFEMEIRRSRAMSTGSQCSW